MTQNAEYAPCPECGEPSPKDSVMALLSRSWHFCVVCSLSFVPRQIDSSGAGK